MSNTWNDCGNYRWKTLPKQSAAAASPCPNCFRNSLYLQFYAKPKLYVVSCMCVKTAAPARTIKEAHLNWNQGNFLGRDIVLFKLYQHNLDVSKDTQNKYSWFHKRPSGFRLD